MRSLHSGHTLLLLVAVLLALGSWAGSSIAAGKGGQPPPRPLVRGLPPSLLPRYLGTIRGSSVGQGPPATFRCLDGSATLAWGQVNDDYCDCADGSDEPGTSACPGTRFYCLNVGHRGMFLPGSRVEDGICDPECCDGSDETRISCPNTCTKAAQTYAQAMAERKALLQAGLRRKQRDQETVARARETRQASKRRLAQRIPLLEGQLASLQRTLDAYREEEERNSCQRAKASQDFMQAKLQALLQQWEGLQRLVTEGVAILDAGPEKAVLDAAAAVAPANAVVDAAAGTGAADAPVDANSPAAPASPAAAQEMPGPPHVEPETPVSPEPLPLSPMEALQDKLAAMRAALTAMREELERVPAQVADGATVGSEPAGGPDPLTLAGVLHCLHPINAPGCARWAAVTGSRHLSLLAWNVRLGWRRGTALLRRSLGLATERQGEEASSAAAADEEQHASMSEAAAKAEHARLTGELEEVKGEQADLAALESRDLGPNREWEPYYLTCIELPYQTYTYKLCFHGEAHQSSVRLGRFARFGGRDPEAASGSRDMLYYDGGDRCWNGPERSVQVALECGAEPRLLAISEPAKCAYEFRVAVPVACREEELARLLAELAASGEDVPDPAPFAAAAAAAAEVPGSG